MNFKRLVQGFFLSFIFLFIFGFFWSEAQKFSGKDKFLANVINITNATDNIAELNKPDLELNAESAISLQVNYENPDKILFSKNEEEKMPIASLTKLMTAAVVLENFDLFENVQISKEAEEQDTRKLLKAGDLFTAKDLLYDMLIESNNSAAFAFYEAIGQDKFIKLMNLKANEIGLKNTYFSSATGLGLTNYSTAKDLSEFAKYILKNKNLILEITTTTEFNLNNSKGVFHHKAYNLNDLLKNPNLKKRIIGGKTGQTKDAGECLLLILKTVDNKGYLINIVLNAKDRFTEMKKMINWEENSSLPAFDPVKLNWEQVSLPIPWEARDSQAVVVFQNKMWLMGGLDANGLVIKPGLVQYEKVPHFSDVWNSEDGQNWQLVAKNSLWQNRRSMQVVEFNGKMWLVGGWTPEGGYKNDVWSSKDGISWTEEIKNAAWPAREGHQLVVFQNKMWLIGGVRYDKRQLFNDVWFSEDGINWSKATANAGFLPRWDHAAAVFNNKIWLTGGMQFGEKILNDVWYSENGADWFLATNSANWVARQGHGLVDYKNKLWIVSRLDTQTVGGKNDVWFSEDGIDWQKTNNDPIWTGREDVGVVVFKDKIWVLGGMDKNWQWKNDIWYSAF